MNAVLIMAKEGSLGLPGKNLWPVKGMTLLEWTIQDARQNALVDKIFVSTNGDRIAQTAQRAGAEVIRRDDELAKNELALAAIDHAVIEIKKRHSDLAFITMPQCVVPFRDPDIFTRCLRFLQDHPQYDSAVTVRQTGFIPEALMKMDSGGDMAPYFPQAQQMVSGSRQDSAGYEIDHAVECFRYASWLKRAEGIRPWTYLGKKIKGVLQNHHNPNCFVDVHVLDDVRWLEFLVDHLGFEGMPRAEEARDGL